ncbi:MAG: GldG family protein [Candidatus Dormiibacterota bacterium]
MRPGRIASQLTALVGVILLAIGVTTAVAGGTAALILVGVALLIASVALDPGWVVAFVRTRQARFGSLTVVVTVLVLAIIVAVNIGMSNNQTTADLTRGGLFSLSPKSVTAVKKLQQPLHITGFFRSGQASEQQQMQDLLAEYQAQNPQIKVQFLDADANAQLAKKYGVDISGDIVLTYGNRKPVVLTLASETESDVTGAIIRLETNRTPTICWASGDGESDLTDQDSTFGYSAAATALQQSNYQTQSYLLSQQPSVPSSCNAVAVVGPTSAISPTGIHALQQYVNQGGDLLLAFDPWSGAGGKPLASVNDLLSPYGAGFLGGLVVEGNASQAATNDPTTPVITNFGASDLGQNLSGRYVYFPHPTAITGDGGSSMTQTQIAQTSDQSYAIQNQTSDTSRQNGDPSGPFTLVETLQGAQSTSNGKTPQIVLVGTSSFADNQVMPPTGAGANDDLLLNSLDWLTGQNALIGIAPKNDSQSQALPMTDSDVRINYVLTLGIVPGLIVVLGLVVLWRRRRFV